MIGPKGIVLIGQNGASLLVGEEADDDIAEQLQLELHLNKISGTSELLYQA